MDLHLDERAFPGAAAPAPLATSSRSVLSATVLTTQYKELDSSLPFFSCRKATCTGSNLREQKTRRKSVIAGRQLVES